MAAQEAVGAATGQQQRDSQEKPKSGNSSGEPGVQAVVSFVKQHHKESTPEKRSTVEVTADIEMSNQVEMASEKLMKQVSADIEESIQKVFVTLSEQEDVVVVIDGREDTVVRELASFEEEGISTQVVQQVEEQNVETVLTESGESSNMSPKKRGRKPLFNDGYTHNQETRQYTCTYCSKTYKSKQSMVIHLAQCRKLKPAGESQGENKKGKTPRKNLKHPPLEEKYAKFFTFNEASNQWTCKKCNKSYKTKQAVMIHKSRCGNQIKSCLYCNYEGRNATNVRVHMMNKHNIIPRLNVDGTWIY